MAVTPTPGPSLPTLDVPADIDKISITNGDKGEVVLEKQGDSWALTKPVTGLANQANVKSLIDNLRDIKLREVVAETADDVTKISDDLVPSKVVHVVAWKGSDKKVDLLFGKAGGRGEMMMLTGRPSVFAASGYSSFLYTRSTDGWTAKASP